MAMTEGMTVVNGVIVELQYIRDDIGLHLTNSLIVDVSEAIKLEYSMDLTKFKTLTATVGLMFIDHAVYDERVVVFNDESIKNLPPIDLRELLGVYGIDLEEYKYLKNCKFYINKIYKASEINQIPGIYVKVPANKN